MGEESPKIDMAADSADSIAPIPTPTTGQQTPAQKPSVGRVVHYVLPFDSIRAGEHRPAVIAQSWGGDTVNLSVHKGQSDDFTNAHNAAVSGCFAGHGHSDAVALVGSVSHDTSGAPGTWHWPERV